MNKTDCAFCDFKDKNVVVYNDKLCYAIISKRPINKHHVLVIPKKHYQDFIDLPDKLASHIFLVAKKISTAVRKACNPDAIEHISDDDITKIGINLVEHYKFHIIPRFKKDRVKIEWNRDPDPGIMARSKFANSIKKFL